MRKRTVFLVLVVLLMGTVGCSIEPVAVMPTPVPAPIVAPLIDANIPLSDKPSKANSASDSSIEARLIDQTWISPAEVKIGNYHSGATAEWNIRIHNGKNIPAEFLISYRIPDDTRDGYGKASLQAEDWVIIADSTPVLGPKETKEILVILAIPKDIKVNNSKWEFWTSVTEQGQGQIRTEMATRWLVEMR